MKLKPNISGRLLLMTLVTGLFAQTACEQDYELDLPLAVTQNTLNLDAGGGQTHVLVYSSGDWNVAFDGDIPWATIDRTSGSGNGEFVFTFELNPGIVRKADVILTSGSNRQVISMIQNGFVGEASLTIMKESAKLPDWESLARVPFDTNMDLALERITSRVTYGDGAEETASEGWISDIVVTEDAILFETAANDTGESRLARLIVEVNDNVNEKIYSSSYWLCFSNGIRNTPVFPKISNHFTGVIKNYFDIASFSTPPICSDSVCLHKDTIREIGGFPTSIISGEDLLTWARICIRYPLIYINVPMAIYHLNAAREYLPTRIPQKNDLVGMELLRLFQERPTSGLKKYIAFWHKNRASCFLRLNMRTACLKECIKVLKYYPGYKKIYIYIFLAFLPQFLTRKVFSFYWKMN